MFIIPIIYYFNQLLLKFLHRIYNKKALRFFIMDIDDINILMKYLTNLPMKEYKKRFTF